MRVSFPNYKRSLVNFTGSIMKEFGFSSCYSSIKEVDRILQYGYTNVLVLVFDGLRADDVDFYLKSGSFLVKNQLKNITSVFPSNRDVTLNSLATGEIFLDNNSKKDIISLINDKKDSQAYGVFPSGEGSYKDRSEMYDRIINLTKGSGKKYIYAYCGDCNDLVVINDEIESLCNKLEDCVVFVTSNIGRIDKVEGFDLSNYPTFFDMVNDFKYLSNRCMFVSVKNSCEFLTFFDDNFSKMFRLIPLHEENKFSNDVSIFSNLSYDFAIVSVRNWCFSFNDDYTGGVSDREMLLPLFAISRKKAKDQGMVRKLGIDDYSDFLGLMDKFQIKRNSIRGDIFRKAHSVTKSEFINLCDGAKGEIVYVYAIEEKVVGFVQFELINSSVDRLYSDRIVVKISKIYVLEQYRRKGIGTQLFEAVLIYSKKVRVDALECLTWSFEEDVQKFLEHFEMKPLNFSYEMKL